MTSWDPDQYALFRAYRDRPALDLMLQIPGEIEPSEIWDLGCGTGEHAALLARRHPTAKVHGLDQSPQMLARARVRPEPVDWVSGEIAAWAPETAPDLIFSNAALHWLDAHETLLRRLAGALAPKGVFACQMPLSWRAPQHVLLREVANSGPWAGRLAGVDGVKPLLTLEAYYDQLAPISQRVDIWTTTYLHVLEASGPANPVLEWMQGTGLRPYLDALTCEETEAFLDAYAERLWTVFPRRPDGSVLLPFERLFVLAVRA